MQRVILLKRPTFLLYDGVKSLPCAISLKVYKLQFPVSVKSSFQDKTNETVAVLIFTMNRSYCDAPTILVLYRKGHSPPVLLVPPLGGEKIQTWVGKGSFTTTGSRGSRTVWSALAGCPTDTVPQQWGYNMAGISDETVSKGCQWQSIKAS